MTKTSTDATLTIPSDASEKEVLTVLSVLYAPVSQARLAEALPTEGRLKSIIQALVDQGLVERKSGRL